MAQGVAPLGYTIRLARDVELAHLADVERRAASLFAARAGDLGLTREHLNQATPLEVLRAANDDGRVWVAADVDGVPVGFAVVRELGLFAHLEELDVLPEHGRKGLGSALIEAVCIWAHSRGFDAVTLSTFRDVPWNAPFFTRHGFATMPQEELPPELLEIVASEAKRGLRAEDRVIMFRQAAPPHSVA